MAERIFGEKCHATPTGDGWFIVYIHLDKQKGSSQAISTKVSLEVAKAMMKEIDEAK